MPAGIAGLHLFQIFYSDATRRLLDPAFIPLDNLENERPDWREYWPIRRYFAEHPPRDDEFYGFLSPAFAAKSRLSAATVLEFFRTHRDHADVLLFSPFFDQIAFFLNSWEQGALAHAGARQLFEDSATLAVPEFRMFETVGCTRNTVYCNYFIARGRFWNGWLERAERIFASAETGLTPLGLALRAPVDYNHQSAPAKVFVIERLVCALLAVQQQWRVKAFNPLQLPFSGSPISALGPELAALDALKLAFLSEGRGQYLDAFFRLRAQFAQSSRPAQHGSKPSA